MNERYKEEISNEVEKLNEDLYQKTRNAINNGQRLPYREYLRRRSIHWLENVATDEEIDDAKTAISNRVTGLHP